MDERILRRIDRAAGVDDLAGALERLAPTDLQTLLLEVADGSFTRWTQALLGDRAEWLLTSGMGTERVVARPT